MTNEAYSKAKKHQDEAHMLDQVRSEIQAAISEKMDQLRKDWVLQPDRFESLELDLRKKVDHYFGLYIGHELDQFSKI